MIRTLAAILGLLVGASFSQEWAVQTPPGVQRGPLYQGSPSLAAFDGGTLAFWYDARSGSASIYSTVVSPDGGVSSTSGVEVVSANADLPATACSNTQCLVAWTQVNPGDWDIGKTIVGRARAVRVGFDGSPIDLQPLDLGPASPYYTGAKPSIASDGTDFLVLFPNQVSGQLRVQSAVVTAAGAVVPGSTVPRSSGSTEQWFPSSSWTGSAYLVGWTETGAANLVRAGPFSLSGALVPDAGLEIPLTGGSAWQTTTSCGDTSCLVAWGHPPSNSLAGIRLALDGTPLDAQPLPLSTGTTQVPTLSAVPEGDGFLFAHTSSAGVTAVHIDASGGISPVAPPTFLDAGIRLPSLAASGGRVLLAVNEQSQGSSDVALSWLQSDGSAFGDRAQILPILGNSQALPVTTQVDGGHVLVWQDWRDGGSELRAAFVDPTAGLSPPDGIPLPTGALSPSFIAVKPCGSDVLVAWDTSTPSPLLQVLRIRTDGTPIGSPITVGQHPTAVQGVTIASEGDVCVVAWSEYDARWDTYAVRFSADGGQLDTTPLVVATGAGPQYLPSAAWDGTAFLIAYANGTGSPITSINARRMNPDGTFVGPAVPLVSTARSHVRVACEGGNCMLLWSEDASAEPTLRVSRIDPATGVASPDGGVVIAQIPRTLNANSSELAAGPDGFHVAWEIETDAGTGIRVARIDPAGPSVLSTEDIPAGSTRLRLPTISAGHPGETFLAYVAVDPPPHDGTRRVRARYLYDRAIGASCGSDGECRSAQCIDGVCCESTCGGGIDTDCQACSAARGSTAPDGTCGVVAAGNVCRPEANACDVAEQCSGTDLVCPGDAFAEDGTACPGGVCEATICELIDAGVQPSPSPSPEPSPMNLAVGCGCGSAGSSLTIPALLACAFWWRRRSRNSFS